MCRYEYNCGWGCDCNPSVNNLATNPSNQTFVVPVAGASAYQDWLAENPDLDPNLHPDSPWVLSYWVENYVQGQFVYEEFEI